jgi:hypothetical protein
MHKEKCSKKNENEYNFSNSKIILTFAHPYWENYV